MYKFIQRYKKQMLAVFSVGLMIVFILPSTLKRRHPHQEAMFHLGKTEVTVGEVKQAADQWREITRFMPFQARQIAPITGDMERNPEYFMMLVKEAQQLGLRVSDEQVKQGLVDTARFANMLGRPTPPIGELAPAMRSAMLVQALFERVLTSLKTSGPAAMHELAENAQRVKLNLAHYAVDDFRKDVAAPTEEQLKKQFDDYKNTPPGNPAPSNPFGFGYLIPSQVRVAYLTVPRDEVSRAVRREKQEIDWEMDAVPMYLANPWKHYPGGKPAPTTLPVAAGATQPTTAPTTEPVAARWNSLSPAGKDPYIQDVMRPMVDARIEEIAVAVNDRMNADFAAYDKKAFGAPQDFLTRAYLDRLSADIEKKFAGIKLGVSEINDPKDMRGLAELKGIGTSTGGDQPFAAYVFQWAEPLVPAVQKTASDVLKIGQPSRRFRDAVGNVYVAQLREAKPAAAPADLNAVKDKVDADVRTKAAYDAAVAAAKKLQEAAASKGLAEAANASNKDVFESPAFFDNRGTVGGQQQPAVLIPRVELPPADRQTLVTGAFALLTKATPDKSHPSSLIELPAAGRVVVAELGEVERAWPEADQHLAELDAARNLTYQRAPQLLTQYFSFDALKQRLEYRSAHDEPAQTAAAQ